MPSLNQSLAILFLKKVFFMPFRNQSLADHISWHTCSSCSTCNLSILSLFGGTVDVAIFIFIWINECKMPHQMSEERNCISSTSKKQSCTKTIKYLSTSRRSCIGCNYMLHWLHFRLSLEKNPPQHLFGCHPEGQCPQVCEIHFPQNMCFKGIDITPPEQFSLKVIDTTSAEQLSFL